MPREGFSRKSEKAGRAGMCDFYLMTPDEPTAAMQNPEKDPDEWTPGDETDDRAATFLSANALSRGRRRV